MAQPMRKHLARLVSTRRRVVVEAGGGEPSIEPTNRGLRVTGGMPMRLEELRLLRKVSAPAGEE